MTKASKNLAHECAALACIFWCIGIPCLLYSLISMDRGSSQFNLVLGSSIASLILSCISCGCVICIRILLPEREGYSVQIDEPSFEDNVARIREAVEEMGKRGTGGNAPGPFVANIEITVSGNVGATDGNASQEL